MALEKQFQRILGRGLIPNSPATLEWLTNVPRNRSVDRQVSETVHHLQQAVLKGTYAQEIAKVAFGEHATPNRSRNKTLADPQELLEGAMIFGEWIEKLLV